MILNTNPILAFFGLSNSHDGLLPKNGNMDVVQVMKSVNKKNHEDSERVIVDEN